MVVYLDGIFLLNALLDYLVLLLTASLSGGRLRRLRFTLCAVLGGLYGTACVLPGGSWLGSGCGRLGFGVLLCVLAFGRHGLLRRISLFAAVAAGLAGLTLGLALLLAQTPALTQGLRRIHGRELLAAAVLGRLLLGGVLRGGARHGRGELCRLSLRRGERRTSVTLLYDTGNTLCDPVSGRAVPVVYWRAIAELWTKEERAVLGDLRQPEASLCRLAELGTHCRLLPYRSVGVAEGLLLLLRLDEVQGAGKQYGAMWVALSPTPVSDGGGYDGLWNEEEAEA